jgi:hypothetical protein
MAKVYQALRLSWMLRLILLLTLLHFIGSFKLGLEPRQFEVRAHMLTRCDHRKCGVISLAVSQQQRLLRKGQQWIPEICLFLPNGPRSVEANPCLGKGG